MAADGYPGLRQLSGDFSLAEISETSIKAPRDPEIPSAVLCGLCERQKVSVHKTGTLHLLKMCLTFSSYFLMIGEII
jgi:hypothetical protein